MSIDDEFRQRFGRQQQSQAPCPLTAQWEGFYERGDEQAATMYHEHIQTCPSCRAEVMRLNQIVQENANHQPGTAGQLIKNTLLGFAAMGGIGCILAFKSLNDGIAQQLYNMGDKHSKLFFKPRQEQTEDTLKSIKEKVDRLTRERQGK